MLTGLINTFSDANFSNPEYNGEKLNLKNKDILGHVYEYYLGQFALAEGKQGGQNYTPKSIVTPIVEMLQPYNGRVYDPAMGSVGSLFPAIALLKSARVRSSTTLPILDCASMRLHETMWNKKSTQVRGF